MRGTNPIVSSLHLSQNYQLKWHRDRQMEIDVVNGPKSSTIDLVGIAEYNEAFDEQVVVVRVAETGSSGPDLYVSYNRAIGMNFGTEVGYVSCCRVIIQIDHLRSHNMRTTIQTRQSHGSHQREEPFLWWRIPFAETSCRWPITHCTKLQRLWTNFTH